MGGVLGSSSGDGVKEVGIRIKKHTRGVSSVCSSGLGLWWVTGSADRQAILFDATTREEVARYLHDSAVECVTFGARDDTLWCGTLETICIWDVAKAMQVKQIETADIKCLQFDASTGLMYGSSSRVIVAWDSDSFEVVFEIIPGPWFTDFSGSMAVSNGILATATNEDILLCDAVTGDKLKRVGSGNGYEVCALSAATPLLLATGNWNGRVEVWSLPHGARGDGKCMTKIEAHSGRISALHFASPKCVVSSSDDHSIKIHNWESRRCLAHYTKHKSIVNQIAVSPDVSTLASVSEGKTMRLWDLSHVFRHRATLEEKKEEDTESAAATPKKKKKKKKKDITVSASSERFKRSETLPLGKPQTPPAPKPKRRGGGLKPMAPPRAASARILTTKERTEAAAAGERKPIWVDRLGAEDEKATEYVTSGAGGESESAQSSAE